MSKTAEELEKRIAVLERKVAREKKARNMAEQQLEQYSLDIYETNQSLQASLAFSKKRQAELEYLGNASSEVVSEVSLNELMANTVSLTGQFFGAECGFYLITHDGLFDGEQGEVWYKGDDWKTDQEFIKEASQFLPLDQEEAFDSWLVSPIVADFKAKQRGYKWVVYVNFAMLKGKFAWIAFFSSADYLDEEALYVLDMARGHLLSGIRKRLSDVRILKRTVQLQETVTSLEQAKRQLIQSEKMASLGQLAAGVAHEINNPIGFVRSNMEILKDYIEDFKQLNSGIKQALAGGGSIELNQFSALCEQVDLNYLEEDSQELLSSNIEGLDRVREIVDNLKSFSHSGDEKLTEVSLNDCINGALKIAWNTFKYEHEVDNQSTDTIPLIMGNKGQLQQVFVNLFVNAAYAMEGGGKLTIASTQTKNTIVVHVSDTGCGMDEKTLNQLFTPFFTTKPVGVGTGLGLSVSYAILEAHHVEVGVDSVVGEGTTFNLAFPLN